MLLNTMVGLPLGFPSNRSCLLITQAKNTKSYKLIFRRCETRGSLLARDFQVFPFSASPKSDWRPDCTPALWGKLPQHGHHQHQGQYQQQQPQQTSYDHGKQEQGNSALSESFCVTSLLGSQHSDNQEKKHWYGNITEGQKHALEVDSKP